MSEDISKMYDDALAASNAAGFAFMPVAQVIADLAAERDALEKQRLKFGEFVAWVREAPVSSGVCCCGDNMADHYRSDHTAYDQWDYSLACWLRELGEQS